MPKSRIRRRTSARRDAVHKAGVTKFSLIATPGGDDDAFRESLKAAATGWVGRLPAMFAALQQLFREFDPEGLLASTALYGLQQGLNADGSTTPITKGLEQNHVELLQAILLTVPLSEWSTSPSMPVAVASVFDQLPLLSQAFLAQRIVAFKDVGDVQARTVADLQERVRFHTHAVRNWGYFSDVVTMSHEIYAPLDEASVAYHGFALSDVIALGRLMVAEHERRMNAWTARVRPVLNATTIPETLERWYAAFPDMRGSPGDIARLLPPGTERDQVVAMFLAHADLRMPEIITYDAASLSELSGLAAARVERCLRAISLQPGSLVGRNLDHLFLSNPIWVAPVIDLGDRFLVPMPQAILSHVHAIVRRLAGDAGLLSQLDRSRHDYLEKRLVMALRTALPGASVRAGVTWSIGDQRFETDAVAFLDSVLVVAEAKAHHLTPEGLRGAPDRVKRHVRDLVVEPSLQSARLERLVADAKAGDAGTITALIDAGFPRPEAIKRVIRISVSLDDLSVLASAESELREAGWVASDHELAPMMGIADLVAVADILDEPIAFLHYLSERGPFQRCFDLLGDELDFLGLYLETGFNLGGLPTDARFAPSGMSEIIDRYYDARDHGKTIPKPRPRTSRYFSSILQSLSLRRPEGWTIIGIHLLGIADPSEQAKLARMLDRARRQVRRKVRGLEDGAVVSVTPAEGRKATVVFYVHDLTDRQTLLLAIENAAAEVFQSRACSECVVFARHVEHWEEPYQLACLAKRRL